LHPCFIPQTVLLCLRAPLRVHSLHAADRSACIAVCFRDIVAFGDGDRARRTAAAIAHLLPRSWRSFLHHGFHGGCTL
jgi:hypothetical protein